MKRIFIILFFILGLNFYSTAQGDLLVTPTRVVFEGNKQKETLNLVNVGKDSATYSISFLQYNMKEDGSFVIVEKPDSGQMFADPYLKVFPRKVRLAPGEPQVVMLQCRRSNNMIAGEYRSHLYFRAEKKIKPLGSKTIDTAKVSVQITPIYGMSIPVIIRSGSVIVKSKLSDLKIVKSQDAMQYLSLTINREGNISIYGDIIIEFIPTQGKPYQVGILKGVGVYTNINKRNINIKLDNTSVKPLTSGKLKVQYVSNGDTKRFVYAEGELDVD